MNSFDYLKLAYRYAIEKSTDSSTQNGALLVKDNCILCYGANHFPRGVQELPERWERPIKYSYVEHAERNVIYTAARNGISTNDGIMYCPWAACTDCMRGIIQSGIRKLVVHHHPLDDTRFGMPVSVQWKDSIKIAMTMFNESGIELEVVTDKIGETIRFNGQLVEV